MWEVQREKDPAARALCVSGSGEGRRCVDRQWEKMGPSEEMRTSLRELVGTAREGECDLSLFLVSEWGVRLHQ